MGLFYTNMTVYGTSRDAVLAFLRNVDIPAFVSPERDGYTVVFERGLDEQDPMAIETLGCFLTEELACPALTAVLHDDDVLYLWLFQNGKLLDRYDSSPAYFDSTSDHRPPEGGDAQLICGAFGRFNRWPRVEHLLRADLLEGELPEVRGEQERHVAIAAELGHPFYVAGLGYSAIAGGYVAEEYRGIVFEAVKGDLGGS